MLKRFLYFAKYNNAFTIIVFICFFSFGLSFAASDTVRDSVYSSTDTVVSVDNHLILNTDLDSFNFNLRITSIAEDGKNYYAAYSYQTLAVVDGVWQSSPVEKVLTVNKEALGGKDLGLFLAKELGDNVSYELSYLKRTQKLEKEKGESQKVVTTEYSGLIGKLLDPKEQVIEGYNPVIPEAAPETPAEVELHPEQVIVTNDEDSTTNPDQAVNTQLVQEVVGQLIQNNATSTGTTTIEATSTGAITTEATSTQTTSTSSTSTTTIELSTTTPSATIETGTPPVSTETVPISTTPPATETTSVPTPEAPAQ